MSSAVISVRYARALLHLAAAAKQVEAVGEALGELAQLLQQSQELSAFLSSNKVPPATKDRVLQEVLAKSGTAPLLANFARLVLQKRRIALLPEMRDLYLQLADERLGRAQAEVTVAEPLQEPQRQALRQRLEGISGKQVTLHIQVNPEILGGAVARIGSTVWDGSLRHQLSQIRQSILQG